MESWWVIHSLAYLAIRYHTLAGGGVWHWNIIAPHTWAEDSSNRHNLPLENIVWRQRLWRVCVGYNSKQTLHIMNICCQRWEWWQRFTINYSHCAQYRGSIPLDPLQLWSDLVRPYMALSDTSVLLKDCRGRNTAEGYISWAGQGKIVVYCKWYSTRWLWGVSTSQ
jgi:hypothetical protein